MDFEGEVRGLIRSVIQTFAWTD